MLLISLYVNKYLWWTCFNLRNRILFSLDMLDELWVEEGEAGELVLVEVHHEELVRGRELHPLARELPVKVGHVLAVALQEIQTRSYRGTEQAAKPIAGAT